MTVPGASGASGEALEWERGAESLGPGEVPQGAEVSQGSNQAKPWGVIYHSSRPSGNGPKAENPPFSLSVCPSCLGNLDRQTNKSGRFCPDRQTVVRGCERKKERE